MTAPDYTPAWLRAANTALFLAQEADHPECPDEARPHLRAAALHFDALAERLRIAEELE